jgi:hypothetical protein
MIKQNFDFTFIPVKFPNYMASQNLGGINAYEGCVRGLYAFSVVAGYTHEEDSGYTCKNSYAC